MDRGYAPPHVDDRRYRDPAPLDLRDRIESEFYDKSFRSVVLGSQSTTLNTSTNYRNVCVYTEDASTPFPCRPFIADELQPTAGQGYDGLRLVNGQASDGTSVTINPGGQIVGTFDDLPAGGGDVKAVFLRARHFGTGGLAPSELDIDIRDGSGASVRAVSSIIPAGLETSQVRAQVPVTDRAGIDALTFRLSARS